MKGFGKWVAIIAAVLPAAAMAGDGEANLVLFFGRFHPLVLHLPIGILTVAVLFEAYNVFRPGKVQPEVTTALTGLAAATAIVAVACGLMLEQGGGYNEDILDRHKWLTIAMTASAITAFILKWKAKGEPTTGYRACLLVAILLLGPGGHEGGNLTHGETFLVEHMPDPPKSMVEKILGLDAAEAAPVAGYYAEHIYPIFKENCFKCHGPEKQKGDYRLDIRADALKAGESGEPGIVPGHPTGSNVVFLITLPSHDDEVMPPEGKGELTDEQIGKIIRWIADGASYGDAPQAAAAPADDDQEQTAATPAEPETPASEENAADTTEPEPEYKAIIAALKPGTFRDQIFPILERSCIECHGPKKDKGDLRLDTPEWINQGADGEPVIYAGEPEGSPFYYLCALPLDDDDVMPPEGKADPVTKAEQELIRKWIADGADFGL